MIKKINWNVLDNVINILLLLICAISVMFKITNNTVLAIILLIINIYMLIKYRKNKLIFLALLMMFYFNYSFSIIKYIGQPANLLQNLYDQLNNYDITMQIGVISQILFLTIINIILNIKYNKEQMPNKFSIKNENKKTLVVIIQVILVLILLFHLIFQINYNTTIFEYSIFLFILAFYFSKENKKKIRITEAILLLFCIYSILCGERIAVLQFIIVSFIMNYMEKMSIKKILLLISLGIILFTIAGLYGDFLDYKMNFKELTFEYIIDTFKERRLALDTSVSAYFSGLSMIDLKNNYELTERLKDVFTYLTKYTLIGSKAHYITPDVRVSQYQVNYGGGFITSYFYFWLGWIGVIGISTYVGFLFRSINKSIKSDYLNMIAIVIVATLPRWFLYVPTFLFRGLILFSILYWLIIAFYNKNELKEYIVKKGKLLNERRTNNNNNTDI